MRDDTTALQRANARSSAQLASGATTLWRGKRHVERFPDMTEQQMNDFMAGMDRWSTILGIIACGYAVFGIIIPAIGRIWGVW